MAFKVDQKALSDTVSFLRGCRIEVKIFKGQKPDIRSKVSYLEKMFNDDSVDLIIAERGGYGSSEICDLIDWKRLSRVPKPLMGYSDITFFHLAMLKYKCGIPIAGPIALELEQTAEDEDAASSLFSILENIFLLRHKKQLSSVSNISSKGLKVIKNGTATASLIPANLTVLLSSIGTKFIPDLKGAILLLEDIGEPQYKVRRCLNQLKQIGILSNLSGLLFGNFKDCGNISELNTIFESYSKYVNGPVVSGIKFGHCKYSSSFIVGQNISVDTDKPISEIHGENRSRSLIPHKHVIYAQRRDTE